MPPAATFVLDYDVPAAHVPALLLALNRSTAVQRESISQQALDTADDRLARAGIEWRLQRQGRRWVQVLAAAPPKGGQRQEHRAPCAGPAADAAGHAGTPPGERLHQVLLAAADAGLEVVSRATLELERSTRLMRLRGALLSLRFDKGRLRAGDASLPVAVLRFEAVSGSLPVVVALVARWVRLFGLVYQPCSLDERARLLAAGQRHPGLRKSARPVYAASASAQQACDAALDECFAQVVHNAAGLVDGDPSLRVEHVHQMRVGIRRLRSALRSFEGWAEAPPPELLAGWRVLFALLGQARDSDVLAAGVAADLVRVGAPGLPAPPAATGPDPAALIRAEACQGQLLAWRAWRAQRQPPPADDAPGPAPAPAFDLPRSARQRLRRWHRRLAADWQRFDGLDEPALHALRKRVKRQRYALEFFAPLLRRRGLARYLDVLAAVQECLGQLNDLFVARDRYQALVASHPPAWFALGWLTARIAEVRAQARPALGRLVECSLPKV